MYVMNMLGYVRVDAISQSLGPNDIVKDLMAILDV